MHEELLTEYIAIVHRYSHQLRTLYRHLEPSIHLKRLVHGDVDFTPTERTITQQIQQWPKDMFLYPPVAWAHPPKGTFFFADQPWSFAFHGAGLSFFQEATQLDVSGEFSKNGTLAITEHTVWCYLSTDPTGSPGFAAMASLHELYFKEVEARHLIVPVPPLLEGDDQTYSFIDLDEAEKKPYSTPAG
jgi:hypothetical protein